MAKLVVGINDLVTLYPEVAKEWHPTKNQPLSPEDFSYGSKEKVWWQCSKVIKHAFQACIKERTRKDKPSACPFCAGQKVSPERSLAYKSPEIAKEWHPTKNAPLTPSDFTNGSSSEKVWRQCSKFKGHEWDAVISSRTRSSSATGCTFCSGNKKI